jgi:hypothetical protein
MAERINTPLTRNFIHSSFFFFFVNVYISKYCLEASCTYRPTHKYLFRQTI